MTEPTLSDPSDVGSRPPTQTAARNPWNTFGRNLLALAASTVVCLFITEGAVRIFMPQFLRPVLRERVGGVFHLRSDLHARVFSPGEFDTRINTTTQRFRNKKLFSQTPAKGVFRIAILGDSFAFGNGANDDDCYPAVLQALLNESGVEAQTPLESTTPSTARSVIENANPNKLRRDPVFEVLNTGIPNSGIGDQGLWYERWVQNFSPDLVVLTVYGGNDVWDEIQDPKFKLTPDGVTPLKPDEIDRGGGLEGKLQTAVLRIPGYTYLTQHSQLLYAVRTAVTVAFSRRVDTDGRTNPAESKDDPRGDEAIEKIAGEIHWIREKVEASGAEFAIVFIPQRNEFIDETRNTRGSARSRDLAARVSAEAKRGSIPFLDLTPVVGRHLEAQPGTLYYLKDDHMRPDGYKLVAEEVSYFLTEATSS